MRIAAVVNPFAGRRKAEKQWPALLRQIGEKAKSVDTFWSEYPGHSESIAASLRRSGYDRVIAVGGDGTLFEVLNGLWWEERGVMPSVGMIPSGTACDYIKNFETGTAMAAKLITAVNESSVSVSLGKCTYQARDGIRQRVFAMVLGLGFDAEVVHWFNSLKFPRSCWLSYALSALVAMKKLRTFTLEGVIEDSPFRVHSLFFAAILGNSYAKGMRIAPHASPTNNRFEFIHIAPVSPVGLLFPILRAYLRLNVDSPALTRFRGGRAKIGASTPVRFEADGELLGETSVIDIELIPEAFSFAAKEIKMSHANPRSREEI